MAATKSASRSSRKRPAAKSPAALNQLEKSLGTAQDALKALGDNVGRDTSSAARALYKDLQKFVREARRDSRKLGTALQRDLEKAQKELAATRKRSPRKAATKKRSSRKAAPKKPSRRARAR